MSRRYGYYRCHCGRTWRSANTWCYLRTYDPEYAQDCQRCRRAVFAYQIDALRVPNANERNDDLSKHHIQELCHKCRNRPFPCARGSGFDYDMSSQSEDDDIDTFHHLKTAKPKQNQNNSNQSNTIELSQHKTNFLDLCSPDSDDQSGTQMTPTKQNQIEINQCTQYTEPQSPVEFKECLSNIQTQTQIQSPYFCNRNSENHSRKRSRNELECNINDLALSPAVKRQKISVNVQSIATKYGWIEINAMNMISFRKGQKRLNVWAKKNGLYSMRIQPMGGCRKDISLKILEETLAKSCNTQTQTNHKIEMTQEMRDMIAAKKKAALERRQKRRETLSQNVTQQKPMRLTEEQRQMIERKRQDALRRRKTWLAKQTHNA